MRIFINIPKHPICQEKVKCQIGLEPTPLVIRASTLTTRLPTPPPPWNPSGTRTHAS